MPPKNKNKYYIIGKNKWSKDKYTAQQANTLAKTLTNCEGCIDCIDCVNCYNCINCADSTNLYLCENCRSCHNCMVLDNSYNCYFCMYSYDVVFSKFCRDCQNINNKEYYVKNKKEKSNEYK